MKRFCLLLTFASAVFCSAIFAAPQASEPIVRAQLTPRSAAVLSAEIGGKIRRLHVLEGGSFQAGDILLSLDDTLQRAQLDRAKAVLSAAERSLTANRRLRELNSVGQIELDLSETEVAKARAEFSYASAMLAKCEIKASFAGRMAEQRVREQEFVQTGQALFEIVDNSPPQVDFIAPSKWLAWLQVGQTFELAIDETGQRYPVVVERIGAKVDPVSQSIKVVAGVTGTFPALMPGMSGSVTPPRIP